MLGLALPRRHRQRRAVDQHRIGGIGPGRARLTDQVAKKGDVVGHQAHPSLRAVNHRGLGCESHRWDARGGLQRPPPRLLDKRLPRFIIPAIKGSGQWRRSTTATTSSTCARRRSGACRKAVFEFVDRSTEDELALRNNRAAFEKIKLTHRALVDVSGRTTQDHAVRQGDRAADGDRADRRGRAVLARRRTGTGQGGGAGEDPVHPGDRRDDLDGEDRPGGEFPPVVPALCLEAAGAVVSVDRAGEEQRVRGADRHHRHDRPAEPRVQRQERLPAAVPSDLRASPGTSCGIRPGSPRCC